LPFLNTDGDTDIYNCEWKHTEQAGYTIFIEVIMYCSNCSYCKH